MTGSRNLALLGWLAALAIAGVASTAFAEDPGSFGNRLEGATIGLPLGAAPAPGLYTGRETTYFGLASGGVNGSDLGSSAKLNGGRVVSPAIMQAQPLRLR